ncbi:mCG147295 [Mus musculus]|nr:mCG147295 [Mus musculus]
MAKEVADIGKSCTLICSFCLCVRSSHDVKGYHLHREDWFSKSVWESSSYLFVILVNINISPGLSISVRMIFTIGLFYPL